MVSSVIGDDNDIVASKILPSGHILGMGVAGLDYILRVEKFPKVDEKIRTVGYKVVGGGNVANTLTAVSKLGVQASLFSM